MLHQLLAMHAVGLLEPGELAGFTPRTRITIDGLAKEVTR